MSANRGRRVGIIIVILILLVLVVGAVAVLLITQLPNIVGDGSGAGEPGVSDGPPQVATLDPDDGGGADPGFVTPTPVPRNNIIIAARDIPRGTRVTVQDVTVLTYPASSDVPLPPDVILVDDESGLGLDQIEGRIARTDLIAGQPVFNFQLTPGDEPTNLVDVGSDPALLIPPGSVAYSLPTNRFGLVAYALRPGDHVDILMSFRFIDVDREFQTAFPNTGIILDSEAGFPLNQFEYPIGRDQLGPFGSLLVITQGETTQRPRQVTQLVIDNAIVLGVGEFDQQDIFQPIVVTQVQAAPEAEAEEVAQDPNAPPQQQAPPEEEEPTPTPTPFPELDVLTLVMDRQDALVLKYGLETGAFVDIVLRSALDDDQGDVITQSVTLQYILDFYGVTSPEPLTISQSPRITSITEPELGEFLDGVNDVDNIQGPGVEGAPPEAN